MNDREEKDIGRRSKPARVWVLMLAVALVLVLGALLTSQAEAADGAYEDWPQQSRAERLGTFTYVYGGFGFASHDGTDEGERLYRATTGTDDDGNPVFTNAEVDSDDIYINGGFGVRLPNEFSLEFGLAVLNGAYDQPDTSGNFSPKPDQPVFEMSVAKAFDFGGPPLLRYTARVGFASIDDPHTEDATFFGVGVQHEPFRLEFRNYDFDVFTSEAVTLSYIYDF